MHKTVSRAANWCKTAKTCERANISCFNLAPRSQRQDSCSQMMFMMMRGCGYHVRSRHERCADRQRCLNGLGVSPTLRFSDTTRCVSCEQLCVGIVSFTRIIVAKVVRPHDVVVIIEHIIVVVEIVLGKPCSTPGPMTGAITKRDRRTSSLRSRRSTAKCTHHLDPKAVCQVVRKRRGGASGLRLDRMK